MNGTSAKVVKRGVPVEKRRTVKLGGRDQLTEADIRQQALTGAFEIVGEVKDRYGILTAFDVRETKYYESDAAFLRRVLGNRKGRSAAIMVMNDEAHHAYRRGKAEPNDDYALDEETAEADAREAVSTRHLMEARMAFVYALTCLRPRSTSRGPATRWASPSLGSCRTLICWRASRQGW